MGNDGFALDWLIEGQGISALEKEAAQTRVFMHSLLAKQRQIITTHNSNGHCRLRFCAGSKRRCKIVKIYAN